MAITLMPQDLLICLKMAVNPEYHWTYEAVATELALSVSQVHYAVQRAQAAALVSSRDRLPIMPSVREFTVHGARYAFPAEFRGQRRGVPTAAGAEPLASMMNGPTRADVVVWPYPQGALRGTAVSPLHSAVPGAVLIDRRLHEVLALFDGIRIGSPRMRELAANMLLERLR